MEFLDISIAFVENHHDFWWSSNVRIDVKETYQWTRSHSFTIKTHNRLISAFGGYIICLSVKKKIRLLEMKRQVDARINYKLRPRRVCTSLKAGGCPNPSWCLSITVAGVKIRKNIFERFLYATNIHIKYKSIQCLIIVKKFNFP